MQREPAAAAPGYPGLRPLGPAPRFEGNPVSLLNSRIVRVLVMAGLAALGLAGCSFGPAPGETATTTAAAPLAVRGVDASFLPEVLAGGAEFRDRGALEDPLHLYMRNGVNTVRLRLWFTPPDGRNALLPMLELARAAARYDLALLLDIHYSDTWADPSHQTTPLPGRDMTGPTLQNAVREYTRDTIRAFNDQGTPPAYVQLGNEIGHGFLWDDGRVEPGRDANWIGLAELLKAAAAGVREAAPPGAAAPPGPRIILHIENGADNAFCREFFDRVQLFGVPYDIIGLSYYPWWHGRLEDLQWNLNDLATRYDRPVLLCETAYPWTLQWADNTHNVVGREDQLLPAFPANPDGQADFIRRVRQIVSEVPGGRGFGLVYWGADDVSVPPEGSAWENMTLFGPEGGVLPALRVLGRR